MKGVINMKYKKTIILIVIALICLCMLPSTASAASLLRYNVKTDVTTGGTVYYNYGENGTFFLNQDWKSYSKKCKVSTDTSKFTKLLDRGFIVVPNSGYYFSGFYNKKGTKLYLDQREMDILRVSVNGIYFYDYYPSHDNPGYSRYTENGYQTLVKSYLKGIYGTSRYKVMDTITLYEITPAPGVRISKIKNLEDDIALSLSALSTRIIAPMPGKGTIGIEIPNAKSQIVSMYSIISSRKFQECSYELPVAIGKTITNEIFMFDLSKMPHLLVAGATGQGKSVGLNAIVTSLLYKKHPAELKFVIVDPKKVEFSVYAPIEKHYLAKLPDGEDAIITDVTKVVQTLKSICVEMDTRYDLLKAAGVRNLREYNERFVNRTLNPEKGHKYLPYIVVIVDEFGDLIITAGNDVIVPITRIAQLARAVGIHMIIATQRPAANIIVGSIRANFPARIAFRVSSMVESRIILDRPGANQLIGKGDMLFLQGNDPVRVQCAFVDTPEVERICNFISEQQGYPTAFYLPEYVDDNASDGNNLDDVDLKRLDPMFEDAARLVVAHQSGSTSLIQRKFSIGYNRAGRIMDQLEKAGVVGPVDGSKPRQVLCSDEMELEMKLNSLNS